MVEIDKEQVISIFLHPDHLDKRGDQFLCASLKCEALFRGVMRKGKDF
jgi:hypothetical protein